MPPAPFLWPLLFYMLCYISLLKFVLVRWCLDVVSTARVLQFMVISGADVVSFGTQKMLFGMLVASTLAPWERSRDTWEHKIGDLGV